MRNIHQALGIGVVLWSAAIAAGQSPAPQFPPPLITEPDALRNVSGGAVARRAPGNMVSAGIARTVARADSGRGRIDIVEPVPGPGPEDVFLADALEILFEELNQALLVFENALRIRAGFPPRVPLDFDPPDAGAGDAQDLLGQ